MDKLLTFEQVAERFPGKSTHWVYRVLVLPRRVDSVKIGGTRFVIEKSIDRLIAQNTRRGFVR